MRWPQPTDMGSNVPGNVWFSGTQVWSVPYLSSQRQPANDFICLCPCSGFNSSYLLSSPLTWQLLDPYAEWWDLHAWADITFGPLQVEHGCKNDGDSKRATFKKHRYKKQTIGIQSSLRFPFMFWPLDTLDTDFFLVRHLGHSPACKSERDTCWGPGGPGRDPLMCPWWLGLIVGSMAMEHPMFRLWESHIYELNRFKQ